jgi:hypothetical protein
MSNARLREALAGTPTVKEKGTPVADGSLTVTPDSPEAAEWRNKSILDCVATTSTYLEDDSDGTGDRYCNEQSIRAAVLTSLAACRQKAERAVRQVHLED